MQIDDFCTAPIILDTRLEVQFFVSKLTREDKIEIYERRKNGETISSLAKDFNIHESNIKYLIALIKKHGYNVTKF